MNLLKFEDRGKFLRVIYGDEGTGTNSDFGWSESDFLKANVTGLHINEDRGLLYITLNGMEQEYPFQAVDPSHNVTSVRGFRDLLLGILNT